MNYARLAPKRDFAVLVCINQSAAPSFKGTPAMLAEDEAAAGLIKLHNSEEE